MAAEAATIVGAATRAGAADGVAEALAFAALRGKPTVPASLCHSR
jgi:hypothetical protein